MPVVRRTNIDVSLEETIDIDAYKKLLRLKDVSEDELKKLKEYKKLFGEKRA